MRRRWPVPGRRGGRGSVHGLGLGSHRWWRRPPHAIIKIDYLDHEALRTHPFTAAGVDICGVARWTKSAGGHTSPMLWTLCQLATRSSCRCWSICQRGMLCTPTEGLSSINRRRVGSSMTSPRLPPAAAAAAAPTADASSPPAGPADAGAGAGAAGSPSRGDDDRLPGLASAASFQLVTCAAAMRSSHQPSRGGQARKEGCTTQMIANL